MFLALKIGVKNFDKSPMSMADFFGRSQRGDTEFLVVRHSIAYLSILHMVYKYMKTKQKPIDQHTRFAVHFPRGALKKATRMKKITVRNILVMYISFAMVHALAASSTIGIATAKGIFRVDNSYVAGNATLFEGVAVETDSSSGELNLSKAKLVMATETRGHVFQDRLILDRGKVQWGGSTYRTVAGEFQIVGVDSASKAMVVRRGNAVQVASLNGTVNVLSATGEMLMAVGAGSAYDFTPEPQGATPGDADKKKKDKAAAAAVGGKGTAVALSTTAKVIITVAAIGAGGAAAGVVATRDTSSNSR